MVNFLSCIVICPWKFQAVYQVSVLLVLNFQGKKILHLDHESSEHANKVKNTLIFNAFVVCQVSYAEFAAVGLNILQLVLTSFKHVQSVFFLPFFFGAGVVFFACSNGFDDPVIV